MDYIARWDMAGESTDETGSYDITRYGGAVQNSDHVYYNGNNGYGQCARLAFNDNQFTIVIKFNLPTIDSDGTWIANSRSSASGSGNEWDIAVYPPSYGNAILMSASNTSGVGYIAEGPTLSTGVDYVFAFVLTGTNIEIYDSGVLVGSAAFSGLMNTGSAHTQFAKRGWSSVASTSCGEMDQSRGVAYDRALTSGEIVAVTEKIKNGW
ncbi:LamG-like jellyroll fold domain-containing protein [Marinobacterium stanieri]|uniref:LamG-like jellyroll fold domain-containing protein n=1 Tax=Marinobacterium stanieri TaxID=49186 RepID=UPI003A952F4B